MALDCTACGACCVGLLVELSPEDEARLSADEILSLTEIDAEGRVRSMKQIGTRGPCIALSSRGGRFLCSIYERRPNACREFEESSRRCHQLREVRGLSTRPSSS